MEDSIEEIFKKLCDTPSDIFEHLPYLRYLSESCDHVTEFGTRNGVSTVALLAGKPKYLVTYDIDEKSINKVDKFLRPLANNTDFKCVVGNTLKVTIDQTDFLFIDTFHTYNHLKQELNRHGHFVKKFIAFHDTRSFGDRGEDGSIPGLLAAIEEFISKNSEWKYHFRTTENNGLVVLSKLR